MLVFDSFTSPDQHWGGTWLLIVVIRFLLLLDLLLSLVKRPDGSLFVGLTAISNTVQHGDWHDEWIGSCTIVVGGTEWNGKWWRYSWIGGDAGIF